MSHPSQHKTLQHTHVGNVIHILCTMYQYSIPNEQEAIWFYLVFLERGKVPIVRNYLSCENERYSQFLLYMLSKKKYQ